MPATTEKTQHVTTVNRKELCELLSIVARGLPRTPIKPEWGCVEIDPARRRIAASCGEFTAQLELPQSAIEGDWGGVMAHVDANRLARLLGSLPDETVRLDISDKRPPYVIVRAGDRVAYRLENYQMPSVPEPSAAPEPGAALEVRTRCLAEAIGLARPAADKAAGRYSLHSLHVRSTENRLIVEATDGRRLHRTVCDLEPPNGSFEALIPESVCTVLLAALSHIEPHPTILHVPTKGGLQVRNHDNTCIFEFPLADGRFPQTDDIVEVREEHLEVAVRADELKPVLDRIWYMDTSQRQVVELDVLSDPVDGIQLVLQCPAGHEHIPAELLNDARSEVIRLDCGYLRDVVKHLDGKIVIAMRTQDAAVRIYSETDPNHPNLLAVIMPLARQEDDA